MAKVKNEIMQDSGRAYGYIHARGLTQLHAVRAPTVLQHIRANLNLFQIEAKINCTFKC